MSVGTWEGLNQASNNIRQGVMQGMQIADQRDQRQQQANYQNQMLNMEERKLAPHLQNFSSFELASSLPQLKKLGIDESSNLYKNMNEWAKDPTMTKEKALGALTSALPEHFNEVRDKNIKYISAQTEKNPDFPNTTEGKQRQQWIDKLDTEGATAITNTLFGKTIQSLNQEKALQELALNKHEIWSPGSSRQVPDGNGGWKWLTAPRANDDYKYDKRIEQKKSKKMSEIQGQVDRYTKAITDAEKNPLGLDEETTVKYINELQAARDIAIKTRQDVADEVLTPEQVKYGAGISQMPTNNKVTVVKTGVDKNGKKVEQLSNGTVRYAE